MCTENQGNEWQRKLRMKGKHRSVFSISAKCGSEPQHSSTQEAEAGGMPWVQDHLGYRMRSRVQQITLSPHQLQKYLKQQPQQESARLTGTTDLYPSFSIFYLASNRLKDFKQEIRRNLYAKSVSFVFLKNDANLDFWNSCFYIRNFEEY